MEDITGVGEQTLIGEITKKVHDANEARAKWNRQALINVMFLYGNHHFTISRTSPQPSLTQTVYWELESRRDRNVIRRTSNYILPLFRAIYSRLIRMKANVFAEPTTSTEKDRDAARVAKEVAEDFWDHCNRNDPWMREEFTGMQSVFMKLFLYAMTVGHGYLEPFFNPKANTLIYDRLRKDVVELDEGETQVRVISPMSMYRDFFRRYTIERRIMSPEEVDYYYDAKVEPCDLDAESVEFKILRTLEGNEFQKTEKDGLYVYIRNRIPTRELPDGEQVICTDKQVLRKDKLPEEYKRHFPCFEFRYQDLGFSRHSQGAIEQCIDLQQDLNFTISRIAQNKKQLVGKVLIPSGSELKQKYDDAVGQIIYYAYGHKPSFEQAPNVPQYYHEDIKRIREDLENMMNSHDVSLGRTPGQVKSGVGIENLSEKDDAQIAPELIMFEQKAGFFAETVLDICQMRYSLPRLLRVSGEDLTFEAKSFVGSQLFGQKQVKIRMGSNFPLNKTARTNYIIMLRKEGFISPERAKDLLEFTDIDGAFRNLDTVAAKQDILNIIEGNMEVLPEPYEDHTIFLKVINDFRKGTIYSKLPPEVRARVDWLADAHQKMLLMEQEAAARLGGPLPPAAQPQMQPQGT